MAAPAQPPDGLYDIVKHAIINHHHERRDEDLEHPSTPPLAKPLGASQRPNMHMNYA